MFPRYRALKEVLEIINDPELAALWEEDETIGWFYQYFTPKELREQARAESAAPRNSWELAFRNQFYTPRYVVQFLTDNTLGRTWYEMRQGDTALTETCQYLVRRPNELFLSPGEKAPVGADRCVRPPRPSASLPLQFGGEEGGATPGDSPLQQPVYIPHRPTQDPRDLKILDPACGSGHFLLYVFDLLTVIYREAYRDPALGDKLQKDYPDRAAYEREIPRLILEKNLYGIDIDLRAIQIAALALWLRAQREWNEMGVRREERPQIRVAHLVCAEPMPGNRELFEDFVATLKPALLGDFVREVWEKMELAGEAGSLLQIERDLREAIQRANSQCL